MPYAGMANPMNPSIFGGYGYGYGPTAGMAPLSYYGGFQPLPGSQQPPAEDTAAEGGGGTDGGGGGVNPTSRFDPESGMWVGTSGGLQAGPNAKYGHYQPGDPNDWIAMLQKQQQQQQPGYFYPMS